MARGNVKRNYIFNVSYQILSIITPLITTPYVSRVLGAAEIGKYSFTASVVSYFTLFAGMGTALYGSREISYLQGDKQNRSIVFWNTEILSCITVLIVSTIYFIFALQQNKYKLFYIILSLNICTVAADITWLFQGLEEFEKIVIRNSAFKLLNIVYIFAFINTKNDIYKYVLGICGFNFLSALFMWVYLPRYVNKINLQEIKPFKNIKTVLSLFVPTIAISVYTVLDSSMIGWLCNNSVQNGYYEQASKISRFSSTFVTSLGPVMIPRIGSLYNSGDENGVRKYIYKSYTFAWFLSFPICFGLVAISDNLVPWFLGSSFNGSISILKIFGFLMIALGINNTTGEQYLIPTGQQALFTKSVIIGAISNFCCNMILIPQFGAAGAAIGSVIAEAVIACTQLFFVRHELSIKRIINLSVKYLLSSLLMLAILMRIKAFFMPSILNSLLLVVIGGCIYFFCLFIMKDQFIKEIFESIRIKIKESIKK
jgi:O-antigen/teichoic acid export membrane protein